MKYWDASALAPLLLDQDATAEVRPIFLEDPDVATWWGSYTECRSATERLRREGRLPAREALRVRSLLDRHARSWCEITALAAVRREASRVLVRQPLRSADALQLAAALVASEGEPGSLDFVCLDRRLRAAAEVEGFNVLP